MNVELKFNVTDKIIGDFFNTSDEITQEYGYSVKIREQLYALKHVTQTHICI